MPYRDPDARTRQFLLSSWLTLTGITVGIMLGYSMWLRWHHALPASRDWLSWAVLIMLLSVYISDTIRGVRRLPGDAPPTCCEHCMLRLPVRRPIHEGGDR